MNDDISLADNTASHRFELRVGDRVAARAEYNVLQGALLFTHTEVEREYEGKGYGSKLAKFALDSVRERGLKAVPLCQFIAGYIQRHPEYVDLVSQDHQHAFMKA